MDEASSKIGRKLVGAVIKIVWTKTIMFYFYHGLCRFTEKPSNTPRKPLFTLHKRLY